MRVVILGAAGQVGREVERVLKSLPQIFTHVFAFNRATLDITYPHAVHQALIQSQPDWIINCAAFTAVDKAEIETAHAMAINYEAVHNLALIAKDIGAKVLHLSTDYIFSGISQSAYIETDRPAPLNVYGKSKWLGEEALRDILDEHFILRVSWVFGHHGANFVKTMCQLMQTRNRLEIVADQMGSPTPASCIADTVARILSATDYCFGTYHYCGEPALSWYDFACNIQQTLKQFTTVKTKHIQPISSSDYLTPAERPLRSILNCEKIFRQFGIMQPSWRIDLEELIRCIILPVRS